MFNSPAPFGTQQPSVFGQNNNVFAPKPFGTPTTPFASQAAVSMFSGTSTGNFGGGTPAFSSPVFGNPASSPVSSVPSFGTPTFTPASGTSSFAGTSIFAQKPNPNTPAFGTPMTPTFGTPTTPVFGTQPAFGTPTTFGATNAASATAPFGAQPFSSGTFGQPNSGFANNSTPAPFGSQSSAFSMQTTTPSTFGIPGFGQQHGGGSTPGVFNQPTYNFGTTPSSTPAFTTPAYNFGTTSSTTPSTAASPFNSTTGPTNNFGQTQGFQQTNNTPFSSTLNQFSQTPGFQQTNNGLASSPFAPVSTISAPLTSTVGIQNSGVWNGTFNQTQSQPSGSTTTIGQTNTSQQTQPAFSFPNIGQQQQPAVPNSFGQNHSNSPATQPSGVVTNPFGTLPAIQLSIGHTRAAPSIQYGISKMPVVEKAAPVRVSPLLMTSRHLSQNRIRLPARKSFYPNNNSGRVPFFSDDEEAPSTPKADALFVPRENPRALVIRPLEHWSSRVSAEKSKDTNNTLNKNGKVSEIDSGSSLNGSLAENDHDKEGKNTETDIEALMPKLRFPDYYSEPQIQELASKERAEPGFCGRVKDFTVGRNGFGSIKFAGETDVRNLDLDSLIQFNNREVIVYLDDSKKPPVGQGLNKAAVVTLLNIRCFDKKTGKQCMEGVRVEKYKEMLIKKACDQGAEFVSYDPINGEWKFRVNHF